MAQTFNFFDVSCRHVYLCANVTLPTCQHLYPVLSRSALDYVGVISHCHGHSLQWRCSPTRTSALFDLNKALDTVLRGFVFLRIMLITRHSQYAATKETLPPLYQHVVHSRGS